MAPQHLTIMPMIQSHVEIDFAWGGQERRVTCHILQVLTNIRHMQNTKKLYIQTKILYLLDNGAVTEVSISEETKLTQ